MVELIEYLLVFGVTAALAGFSVVIFGGFLPVLHQTQTQSELEQIAGAAGYAAQNGTATVVLPLSDAAVSCSVGSITLSAGGSTYSAGIGAACDFSATSLSGLCTLSFTRTTDGIDMGVDC